LYEESIKNLPHPFAKEMDTCNHLASRIHQLKRMTGLEVDGDQAAKEFAQEELARVNREKLAGKLSDGKIQDFQSKQEREMAAIAQVGGGKKNKGKKQKQQVNQAQQYEAELFTMDIVTIQKFALIGISPPTNPDDLEKKQKEIADKLQWYEDNGKQALDDQIKEMQRARVLQEERDKEI
jgi:hypothetical protein